MEYVTKLVDICLHLDVFLNDQAAALGPWLYLILFAVIFCETGLVVTPILPGDSLLFAAGAIAALPDSPISLPWLLLLLCAAAVLGDFVNYTIGFHLGPKVFRYDDSIFLNKKHLIRTQHFYEKYGSKTIVIARFMPIIRTFAPFVAGIGKMDYRRFFFFNVFGGLAWVSIFLPGGYFFGNNDIVRRNFLLVILAIVFISVLPAAVEVFLARWRSKNSPAADGAEKVLVNDAR